MLIDYLRTFFPSIIFNDKSGNYEVSNQTFANETIAQLNYTRTDLGPALVFIDCQFQKIVFQNCQLVGVAFQNCRFQDCQFNDVQLAFAGMPSSHDLQTNWSLQNTHFNNSQIIGQGRKNFDVIFTDSNQIQFNNTIIGSADQHQSWKCNSDTTLQIDSSTVNSVSMSNVTLGLLQSSQCHSAAFSKGYFNIINECVFTDTNFHQVSPLPNSLVSSSSFLAGKWSDTDFNSIPVRFENLQFNYFSFNRLNHQTGQFEWSNNTLLNSNFLNCNLGMHSFDDSTCIQCKFYYSYISLGHSNNTEFSDSRFRNIEFLRDPNPTLTTEFKQCSFEYDYRSPSPNYLSGFTNSQFINCDISGAVTWDNLDYSVISQLSTYGSAGNFGETGVPSLTLNNVTFSRGDLRDLELKMTNGSIYTIQFMNADVNLDRVFVKDTDFWGGTIKLSNCDLASDTIGNLNALQIHSTVLADSSIANVNSTLITHSQLSGYSIRNSNAAIQFSTGDNGHFIDANLTISDSEIDGFHFAGDIVLNAEASTFLDPVIWNLEQITLGNITSMDLTAFMRNIASYYPVFIIGSLNKTNLSGLRFDNLTVSPPTASALTVTDSNFTNTDLSNLHIVRDEMNTNCSWTFDENTQVRGMNLMDADVRGLCMNTRYGFFGSCNSSVDTFNQSNVLANDNTQTRPIGCDILLIEIGSGIAGVVVVSCILAAFYFMYQILAARSKPDPLFSEDNLPAFQDLTVDLESSSSEISSALTSASNSQ